MTPDRVNQFRPFVTRKLAAEGIPMADGDAAVPALSKCVMGVSMVKAYWAMVREAQFVTAVRPLFEDLQNIKAHFRASDFNNMTAEEITAAVKLQEAKEHALMLAWARSTSDINPGMVRGVQLKHITYSQKTEEYLSRVLGVPA